MKLRRILPGIVFLIIAVLFSACSAESNAPILDSADLLNRIQQAEDGAVLFVGDLDLTPAPGISNAFARITIQKSITLKSAYRDRNAVFTNAGFNLTGSKISGETLECNFVGITFDGGVCAKTLETADWELPMSEDGTPRLSEPEQAQYAVSFCGNVDARFDGCVFENYMYECGPVMRAYYGDYTGTPELAALLGDYSGCSLSIALTDCVLTGNAALTGGAVYLDGSGNVRFRADSCTFSGNLSGCGEFSEGGGACRFDGVDAVLANCCFTGNEGNHCYIHDLDERIGAYKAQYAETDECERTDYLYLADTDRTQGGAIFVQKGSLLISDSVFSGNRASKGGAIRLINTAAQIEQCVFADNAAVPTALNPYDETGPWSAMGMGGAVYIDTEPGCPVRIYASDFTGNCAEYAYGSIYGFWTNEYKELRPLGLGSVDLYSCTLKDNICRTEYDYEAKPFYPWASHPGDILEIEYLNLHGCVFLDETFGSIFPRYELPSSENEYCFFAAKAEGAEYAEASALKVPKQLRSQWEASRITLPAEKEKSSIPPVIWILPCILSLAAAFIVLLVKRRTRRETAETVLSPEAVPITKEASAVEKAVFEESDIVKLRNHVVLRQLLTDRELEVMCEYISGSSRSQLAEKLMISEATVKTHISNIYSKLDVRNKNDLMQKLKRL